MRFTAISLVLLCLWLPGAASSDDNPPDSTQPDGHATPLRQRVAKLEARVKKLESQTATLRVLICLQLPSCSKEAP